MIDEIESLEAVDVVIVCTDPYFSRVAPTLRQLMHRKIHAVVACDEMAWPWFRNPHLGDAISNEAIRAGIVLLGLTVDADLTAGQPAPTIATAVKDVREVRVRRVVDLSPRRIAVQRRAGVTLTPEKFRLLVKAGQLGQFGVGESVVLIAQGLGRHPMRGDVRVSTEAILAGTDLPAAVGTVEAGRVRGVRLIGTWDGDGLEISVDVTLAVDAEPASEVEVVGDRTVRKTAAENAAPEGTADAARVLVDAARHVPTMPVGLRTALDLPPRL